MVCVDGGHVSALILTLRVSRLVRSYRGRSDPTYTNIAKIRGRGGPGVAFPPRCVIPAGLIFLWIQGLAEVENFRRLWHRCGSSSQCLHLLAVGELLDNPQPPDGRVLVLGNRLRPTTSFDIVSTLLRQCFETTSSLLCH